MKEIIITVIGAAAGILLGIAGLYDIYKKHKVKVEVKLQAKQKEANEQLKEKNSTDGLMARAEVRRSIKNLIYEFKFNIAQVLRFHNSGEAIKTLNSTLKVTIEFEEIRKEIDGSEPFGLSPMKHLWQRRELDVYQEIVLEDILLDKIKHIKDMEDLPENVGFRRMYNKSAGKELLFIQLGFVGFDYLVFAIQRNIKEPLLGEKKIDYIGYQVKEQVCNIYQMIKSGM